MELKSTKQKRNVKTWLIMSIGKYHLQHCHITFKLMTQVSAVQLDGLLPWVTVMILSFQTDGSGQTVHQSDQGLHCLQFRLHHLYILFYNIVALFKF